MSMWSTECFPRKDKVGAMKYDAVNQMYDSSTVYGTISLIYYNNYNC